MAATALSLRFKRVQNPRSFCRLFSSDSPITTTDEAAANTHTNTASSAAASPPPPNSFKSYSSDVKSSLNQHHHQQQQSPLKSSFSLSENRKPIQSLEEIGRNLSEYRRLPAPNAAGINTPPPSSKFPGQISLEELYNKSRGSTNSLGESGKVPNGFDAIRQSLSRRLNDNKVGGGPTTNNFLGQGNVSGPLVYGGSDSLPAAALGKEREMRSAGRSIEFLTSSTPDELGRMLSKLRPEEAKNKSGGQWFSLAELNERLSKVRQLEQEEQQKVATGQLSYYNDIRKSLQTMKMAEDDKTKKTPAHKLDILSQLGLTEDNMSSPPKKHLIEKYFHPDNMSSAEKLKIELKKVREEFKMSESDCGSARVQVAQLTTKIKHLSTVLHKKDKHSRKGLTAMVTQRKKLLKYLRRTDWDSYCLVLSKLGLRDNPDYKN